MNDPLPAAIVPSNRLLTAAGLHKLGDVPPEVEWFANIGNPNTRSAYENAIHDFIRFTGIEWPAEFRTVTRSHVIAWRDDLASRALGGATVQHRLAALSSLFEYLCERNAVTHNPVKGVKRPPPGCGCRSTGRGRSRPRHRLADGNADAIFDAQPQSPFLWTRGIAFRETLCYLDRKGIDAAFRRRQLVGLDAC